MVYLFEAVNHWRMRLQDRIGIQIKEIRKSKNLTQEELAGKIARSVDTLSLLERGRIVPSLETLQALAKGLGLPLRDLIDFGDQPSKDPEMVALQAAAIQVIRQMKRSKLEVAVKQLDALSGLKG